MKKICLKLGLLSCCMSLIVASGSAPATTGAAGDPVAYSYELFNSKASATSVLGGTAQRVNNANGGIKLVSVSGSLKHDTGATTISDGSYTLTDATGADGNNLVTDGSSSLVYTGNFLGSYQYAKTFEQSYKVNGVFYDMNGIVGIVTNAADVPKTASATYSGDAEAVVLTSTVGYDLKAGKSNVTADFAAGKVSVVMNGFTAVNQVTGAVEAGPIDEIKISNMTISGNGFSGGSFETLNVGSTVDITGANSSKSSQGSFFGKNSGETAPAEVGGNIFMKGDSGLVSGFYLAK